MSQGIFNAKVIGNVNQVYESIVNFDIGKLPWSTRQEEDWYFLEKRKSYIATRDLNWVEEKEERRITDVIKEDNSWCAWGDCYIYYYAVNQSLDKYNVLRRDCDGCDITIVDTGRRCPCWDTNFSTVFGRAWDNLWQPWGSSSELYNENTFGYINTPKDIRGWVQPRPGEFLYITGIDVGSSAPCGQARQILSVFPYEWDDGYGYTIQVSVPWTNIAQTVDDWIVEDFEPVLTDWAIVIITDDVGDIPSYLGEDWITTIVWWEKWDVLCDYWDTCLISIEEHNWLLTYLTDTWFNIYGWTWFDAWSISANNVNNVGRDKIDSVSFQNFLVFFGRNKISTIVFNQDGSAWFKYKLRDDIGLHNKGAHALFDNGLFFIGSDKRIYGASINSNGDSFNLDLEDITKNVFSHMNLTQDNDELYMDSYWNRLYIFINGRHDDNNPRTSKTKILIYDKTYWLRLVHTLCSQVITGIRHGEFIGDNIYDYCGWSGDHAIKRDFNEKYTYEAIAEAIIYKNDNHWLVWELWLPLDMFRKHKLMNWVFLLWQWQYSEDTYIQVDKYNQYRFSRTYPIDTSNEVIQNWNDAMSWIRIEPSECFLNQLSDCDNVKNPCVWSNDNYTIEKESCWVCTEKRLYDDYCICYDDNWYALSPVHKFEQSFDDDSVADFWRVSFISWWLDIARFGWMLLFTDSEETFDVEVDPFTVDCCLSVPSCPNKVYN